MRGNCLGSWSKWEFVGGRRFEIELCDICVKGLWNVVRDGLNIRRHFRLLGDDGGMNIQKCVAFFLS